MTDTGHGTLTRYRYGCKCEPCLKAHSTYRRGLVWRRMDARVLIDGRLVAPLPPERHGRHSTYTNHGCRCAPCADANRIEVNRWRKAKSGR